MPEVLAYRVNSRLPPTQSALAASGGCAVPVQRNGAHEAERCGSQRDRRHCVTKIERSYRSATTIGIPLIQLREGLFHCAAIYYAHGAAFWRSSALCCRAASTLSTGPVQRRP